ncbi:MAG: UDP-N-acetylglucosamine--LPS N-acetylglucosamine transferase [Pikeienuella sp.]
MNGNNAPKRILAVASSGGHWEQMMLIAPAFEGAKVSFACTDARQGPLHGLQDFHAIADYNQNQPIRLLRGLIETGALVRRLKPDVVISTGAAPGLLCLLWGRLSGARTIWVDSIANSEKLSLSGRLALKFCHVALTQWETLATGGRPDYRGSVI